VQDSSDHDVDDLSETRCACRAAASTQALVDPREERNVVATAWVNNTEITRKVLPPLTGQVGKVALGCATCRASSTTHRHGKPEGRPKQDKP